MGQPLRIYTGGGAQVNLYDATNGPLYLGFCGEEMSVEEEMRNFNLSDGNVLQRSRIASFEIPLLQTDSTGLNSILARKGTLQEVYIVGMDSAIKMSDVFVSVRVERSGGPGDVHRAVLTGRRVLKSKTAAAKTPEENYVQFIQNLLGDYGNMNTDGGFGVAEGWAQDNCSALSIDTSHLAGRGNEQRVTLDSTSDWISCRVRCPIDDNQPIKMTASAYVKELGSATANFRFGIRIFNDAEGAAVQHIAEESLTADEETRVTYEFNQIPNTSLSDNTIIELVFFGSASGNAVLGIDDCQLEFGEITDYTEND